MNELIELSNKVAQNFLTRRGYEFVENKKICKDLNVANWTVEVTEYSTKIRYQKLVFGSFTKKSGKFKQKAYFDIDKDFIGESTPFKLDKTCREYPKLVISGWVKTQDL